MPDSSIDDWYCRVLPELVSCGNTEPSELDDVPCGLVSTPKLQSRPPPFLVFWLFFRRHTFRLSILHFRSCSGSCRSTQSTTLAGCYPHFFWGFAAHLFNLFTRRAGSLLRWRYCTNGYCAWQYDTFRTTRQNGAKSRNVAPGPFELGIACMDIDRDLDSNFIRADAAVVCVSVVPGIVTTVVKPPALLEEFSRLPPRFLKFWQWSIPFSECTSVSFCRGRSDAKWWARSYRTTSGCVLEYAPRSSSVWHMIAYCNRRNR